MSNSRQVTSEMRETCAPLTDSTRKKDMIQGTCTCDTPGLVSDLCPAGHKGFDGSSTTIEGHDSCLTKNACAWKPGHAYTPGGNAHYYIPNCYKSEFPSSSTTDK